MLGAALLAGAAGFAAAADGGAWYAPASSLLKPGALAAKTARPQAERVGRPTILPMTGRQKGIALMNGWSKAPVGTRSAPQLQYYGGPMLGNVKIQVVYWNKDVAYQGKIPGFFSTITKSPYFDWLHEYNAGGQAIGEGSYAGAYTDSVAIPQSAQIEDADIRTELTKLVKKNAVAKPGANTLYMVYFPPGLNIDLQGSGSCQVFCAYHNTFTIGGQEINYGVIPDQGGSCAGGCGGAADQFDNETSVSSHEMIEAVTDPAVGLVTGNNPTAPMGWYDTNYGEIGDICNAVQGQVAGYTVQREWSNSRGLCIDSASDSGTPVSLLSAPGTASAGMTAKTAGSL
ncbi:MAG: hypothetical protein KGM24_07415 [Elusimicrobia bacterium]|nr:hypothetical protein [Elusimicrobiota bacterium]